MRHVGTASPPAPQVTPLPVPARRAVSFIFFVNGVVLASWLPHIPAIKSRHAISDGELGIVLLSMAVGAMLALPLAGWLVGRAGSRFMTSAAALALCLALPFPLLSPNVAMLSLSLIVLGACNATLDVSMNAQAVAVEERYRRAIMSSFHGLFSLGGLVGAGVAGGAMALGAGDVQHVLGTAVASLLAVGCCLRWLLPSGAPSVSRGGVFARPTGALFGLGALAFCALLAEGAMGDWSAVYLHDTLGSSPALAAAGFAVFSLAMAAGRFGGDRLVLRFGSGRVLRTSSAVAAIGLGGALVIGRPAAGIVGCGLVGLGISNIIPILFSTAGRVPGIPAGTGLAAVATTGYFGFLAGPPVIGLVAEAFGLRGALGIVSVLCAFITAGTGVTTRAEPRAAGDYSVPRAPKLQRKIQRRSV
jgi:fucose permease